VVPACPPAGLKAPCTILSFGSNGDFSFEKDVLAKTACHVHTFDWWGLTACLHWQPVV
jgi:hypothetical protein